MLLPRFPLPSHVSYPPAVAPSSLKRAAVLRSRHLTIDDEAVQNDLARMLAAEPLAFLAEAAVTATVLGPEIADLSFDLLDSGRLEGEALARALDWLLPGPSIEPLLDPRLPAWLAHLDRTALTGACRRRDGPELTTSSYLVEVTLADSQVGTLYARIDHALNGAMTQAFVVDEPVEEIRAVLVSAERLRRRATGPPRPFRPIQPSTARRALAGALHAADEIDLPVDLLSCWPSLRPLVSFLVHDAAPQPSARVERPTTS